MCYTKSGKDGEDVYSLMNGLLSDKKGGPVFACFDVWHFCYIALFIVIAAAVVCALKNRSALARIRASRFFINAAFGVYIADFFLMPFAYGEIDIEKLPFHVCTAMCVMCFLSNRIRFLEKYKWNFALLGFISNLVYLIYPAGVMWHQVHPLSYRVVQTLTFHGLMTVYGLLVLAFESDGANPKKCYRDLTVLAGMTAWAMLGNLLYNGETQEYSHFFNWFFVVRDPFYVLPQNIAPFVMPFLNVAVFFAVEMIVYLIVCRSRRTTN